MRTYKEVIKSVKLNEIESITCDRCGRGIVAELQGNYAAIAGGKLNFSFGWGSNFDLMEEEIDPTYPCEYELCDDCCEGVFKFIAEKRTRE